MLLLYVQTLLKVKRYSIKGGEMAEKNTAMIHIYITESLMTSIEDLASRVGMRKSALAKAFIEEGLRKEKETGALLLKTSRVADS
jgi:hypothetical protein